MFKKSPYFMITFARSAFLFGMLLTPGGALAAIDYATQVEPILRTNCYKCHGGPRAKKDFRMDALEKFKENIGPGKFIVPGDPQGSELIVRITMAEDSPDRMPPPNRGSKLTSAEANILRTWIQEGAKTDPAAPTPEPTPGAPVLQTFTSTAGTELKAFFVKVEGDQVTLRAQDGKEKAFPLAIFSDASKELIKTLSTAPAP